MSMAEMDDYLERIDDVYNEITSMTKGDDKGEEYRRKEKDREARKLRELKNEERK
jgi:hypothetical protein